MKRCKTEPQDYIPTKKIKSEPNCDDDDVELVWSDYELLSQHASLEPKVSKSIVHLLEEGNTVPFIARYRRNLTGNMEPEDLRNVKEIYEDIACLRSKVKTVSKVIKKTGSFNEDIKEALKTVTTMEELEHIYAPFKPASKKSLAERAKVIGLQEPALNILNNRPLQKKTIEKYIDDSKEGLKSINEIEKGITNIIASHISSDTEVLKMVREVRSTAQIFIETKKRTATKSQNKTNVKKENVKLEKNKNTDESKYDLYFNFRSYYKSIKPHQVLAINRGETNKILSVKIDIPNVVFQKYSTFCKEKWKISGQSKNNRTTILMEAITDSYNRLIQPLITREIRSSLKQMAERASCEQFSKNLKQIFLATPIKGKLIMGIDPGFAKGCKIAVISETGAVLAHDIIFPFKSSHGDMESRNILKDLLLRYRCEVIALGNGTACRETEKWLSSLISKGYFGRLNVVYTIVNESGASIYSCSSEAKKEFADLDPNIISAISLARRVQEPLAELVKVEPQHLGIGMYQHDLKKKQLNEALQEVVSECVSFVGVDINTASSCLLKSIAGLSDKRAECIVNYRNDKGSFKNRMEILKVKGIGDKVFKQCAGFLRIEPVNLEQERSFYKNKNSTKLDRTIIHPESYDLARKILEHYKLAENDIGTKSFINEIKKIKIRNLHELFECDKETISLIFDSFEKPLNYDFRSELNIKPLFREGLTNIESLRMGSVLSGRVENVTSFGCFVDIGVGRSGLIHVSKLKYFQLQVGSLVKVEVCDLDIDRGRIGLSPISVT